MQTRRAALTVALLGAALFAVQALGGSAGGSREERVGALATPRPSPGSSPASRPASVLPLAAASPTASPASRGGDVVAVGLRKDNKIALVDPVAGKVVKKIDAGLSPGTINLAPDKQTAWVFSTQAGESAVAIVDLVKAEKRDDRRLRDDPGAVAFSTDGTRAYVALTGNKTSPPGPSSIAFLSMTGGEFGHVELGQQTKGVQIRRELSSLAVSPGSQGDVLYAAGEASGVVWVMDAGSGALLSSLEVGGGPTLVVPDAVRHRTYVLVDTLNQVVVIDTDRQVITDRVELPGRPSGAVVGADGTLFVAGGDSDGKVWIIGSDTMQLRNQVQVGKNPSGLAIASDGTQLYVASRADGTLTVVNIVTLQVGAPIPVGAEPLNVVVAERPAPREKTAATATPGTRPTPTLTPTIVPAPTALPEGARPPEHMPSDVVSEDFLSGAEFPVSMAFAPDGRLFYNELRTGKIRVVQNGTLVPDAFYKFGVAGQPETGLLGLTLDPDFAHNHYVYVFYTSVPDGGSESGGSNGPNQVVRLTDVANKGTELTPILRDLPSGPIHNAGTLRFGPADGKLYVSLGDNDLGSNAQDLGTLAGKILRVNPDGSIPDDNPFVGQNGKQAAIWAYGLRNAYSFAFQPLGQALVATENGPGDNDELDVIVRGGNYGWPPTGYKYKAGVIDPVAVMNPPIGPTGATFYLGDQIQAWKNDLFYCNYHQGQLRRVRLAPGSFDRVVLEEVVKQGCTLDVATGPDGALYYSDAKGIYRIRQPGADVLPAVNPALVTVANATPTEVLPTGMRDEDRDINISMSEWKLQPSRSKVPAGTVRLLAEDTGATQHSLRVVGGGLDVSTDTFGPGQSRSLQIVMPAGTYQLICPLPGHAGQGMVATLDVVAP